MAEQIRYSIIQERPDALLVRTEATRLVGWAPRKNASGRELSDKEICGIVGRNGVPEKVYQEKGLTSRRSRMVEVSFDNLHYNDKNQVVLVRGSEEKTVAKSYVEQPDMLKKTVLIPSYYAQKVGLEGGKEMFLTTRTMQYEINRHFSQLEKQRENDKAVETLVKDGFVVPTNQGDVPLRDYLEIRAGEAGYKSYEEMRAAGMFIPVDKLKQVGKPEKAAEGKDLPVKDSGKKEPAQHSKKGKDKGKAR